jgi:mono/diheme cytochrome c family protein
MARDVWRLALLAAGSALASGLFGAPPATRAGPTFSNDVAPLVYAKCAQCHHPDGVAPFSLLSYEDLVEHAIDVRRLTKARLMPPWKPVGSARFRDDRSLTPAQIDLLAAWIDGGMERGGEPPPAPVFPGGWQLGQPDVILELPEAYTLAAEGRDVYRNFVIPAPANARGFVRAWELRPRTKVIHHAILNVDRLGLARARDAADPGPGFGGIDVGDVQSADGLYLVWTPGRNPSKRPAGTAWRVDGRTDLVLQLHMQPSGKPEIVSPQIGLYLSDAPPTVPTFVIRVGDPPIDIPPGDPSYAARAEYELPTAVQLVSVFPHAHYLARSARVSASLPSGEDRELLRIEEWDFAWQDQYFYEAPVLLPARTKIAMEFSYDNSDANPRNPSHPPRRVRSGERSVDEMGNVTFEVIPTEPNGLNLLREARYRYALAAEDSARNHYNLANALKDLGRTDEAIAHYRRAIERQPTLTPAHFNLSLLLLDRGEDDEALKQLRIVLTQRPGDPDATRILERALAVKAK